MMEFTLSRVAVCVCGLMIMAVVAGPAFGIFEDRADDGYASLAEDLASDIDSFASGEADRLVMDMSLYLPEGAEICVSGYVLTLLCDGSEHTALLHIEVEGEASAGRPGVLVFVKTGGGVSVAVF